MAQTWEARYAKLAGAALEHFNGCETTRDGFLATQRVELDNRSPGIVAMESEDGLKRAIQSLESIRYHNRSLFR